MRVSAYFYSKACRKEYRSSERSSRSSDERPRVCNVYPPEFMKKNDYFLSHLLD